MKAEIKNITVTLGEREIELTEEEAKALQKALNEFFFPKVTVPVGPVYRGGEPRRNPAQPYGVPIPNPIDPNKIWCSVKETP